MKKSRILMAAGAFVLTVAGVAATKANKKFTASTTAYAISTTYGNFSVTHVSPATSCFTSTAAGNIVVKLNIGAGVYTLVTSTLASPKQAYYF